MKLKKWVRVTLVIIFIILLGIYSNYTTKKAINECVANGNSKSFCEYNLSK